MSGVSTKSLATDRLNVMEITKMVASYCDNTCTAFRTEPPLTKEVLDCAVTNFFPAGLGDMFSTKNGLLIVARVGIPNSAIEDYARYLTSAEKKVDKQRETDEKKRQDGCKIEPMNRVCPWNKSFHTKFQTEPVPENARTKPQLSVQAKMANGPEQSVKQPGRWRLVSQL